MRQNVTCAAGAGLCGGSTVGESALLSHLLSHNPYSV